MTKVLTTEVYFARDPEPTALSAATSASFGIPTHAVITAPMLSDVAFHAYTDSAVEVLWRRELEDQPGEFPAHYSLAIPEEWTNRVFDTLRQVAVRVGIPFVTEGDVDWESRLYLPDGTVRVIPDDASDQDDYAIRLRPIDRAALRRAIASSLHAAAS